jgi:hypothetical protein
MYSTAVLVAAHIYSFLHDHDESMILDLTFLTRRRMENLEQYPDLGVDSRQRMRIQIVHAFLPS